MKIFLILLLPLTVQADTLSFAWDLATERSDGTPMNIDEIAFTLIMCVKGSEPTFKVPAPATTVMFEVEPGTYTCTTRTEDTDGLWSDPPSNFVTQTAKLGDIEPKALPNSPTNFRTN